MSIQLKKRNEQVIVLTGATSGIGLATARMAAEGGAKLVLAARDGDALDTLAHEMRQRGVEVVTVAADVGVEDDVRRIGQAAIDRFGRVDTWINDAGVSVYGKTEDVALEDMQRVMQTNFWGVVNGSLEAVRLLKAHGGGAIINLGSETSDAATPLQGVYSASKHAIKAFTDALRMELAKDKAPISVTLIKPAAIGTPFTHRAKNYMDKEPALPPPIYAPEIVAKTILHAAEKPERDLYVGGRPKITPLVSRLLPGGLDRLMRAGVFKAQQSDKPSSPNRRDALHQPVPDKTLRQEDGSVSITRSSPYTSFELTSNGTKAVLLGGALLAAWVVVKRPGKLGRA